MNFGYRKIVPATVRRQKFNIFFESEVINNSNKYGSIDIRRKNIRKIFRKVKTMEENFEKKGMK